MYYTLPMSRLVIHLILRETLNAEKIFVNTRGLNFHFSRFFVFDIFA